MMSGAPGLVERAFQLALESASVDEIRSRLRTEGYFNIDAHLTGRKLRSDLVKVIRQAA